MLYNGQGGRGYFHKHKERPVSMKQKLYTETYEACEVGVWVNPILENMGYEVKEIHTDLNKDPLHPSNAMLKSCMGLITGYGFVGVSKPESWAAKTVANYFSKPKKS